LARRGETKVADLDAVHTVNTGTDEDVLRLQIPVHDAEAMDMCETFEQLPEESPDFLHIFGEIAGNQITERL
jgi:hypothetical protein